MKLSQGVEWALHCVSLLAQASVTTPVRRDVLAAHYGLPETYLAKHLQALTRAGVLSALTGPKGGYQLGRPAAGITVLDILEAVEGAAPPFLCQEIRRRGTGALAPHECPGPCGFASVMADAHEAWRASLRSATVQDVVGRLPAEVRERNARLLEEARS
ncbi:RrF2 family transcriptional regulator [Streptomyces sp. NPDC059398]|uniref:RrF2 family transcriptional regulator n=1 Tax=Streptomyces sp. NPDC059398 TaxID=3346820 RepID=UPI0036B05B88